MRAWTRAAALATALVAVLGGAAWISGSQYRFFDYDEIYYAHATWLVAQGALPFRDFQASHSPVLWYPLSVAWLVLPDTPATLLPLRYIAGLGGLLSIAAMTACMAAVRRELQGTWLFAGAAAVAFNRDVLDCNIEFRPDGWSTALLFVAFLLVLIPRSAGRRRCAAFGAVAGLAVLASPKLAVLPALFVLIDELRRVRRHDDAGGALGAYALGSGAALAATVAFFEIVGIDPRLAFQMAVTYQWTFASHSAYGFGLAREVTAHPALLALVAVGISGWCAYLISARTAPMPYEVAVLLFLAAQLVLVDRPYQAVLRAVVPAGRLLPSVRRRVC